jgi:hypothetical protein
MPDSHPYRIASAKCRINTVVFPDDEQKEINVLRKIVYQVGFIYKIIQGRRSIALKLMKSFTVFTHSIGIFSRLNEKCAICGILKLSVHKSFVQVLYEQKRYK